jgi:curved DNA-binding protein CbpA
MVPDPYRALGLPHEATPSQIKVSYRKLAMQYHPDRLTRQNASPEETKEATDKFAAIAAAYQLLSDPQRKKAYDHIFKYGGYDEPQESQQRQSSQRSSQVQENSCRPFSQTKERSKGIGYVVRDPFSMLFSNQGKAAVAGVQIPARLHLSHPPPGGGLRFAFSSGQFATTSNGSKKFVSKTTQFVDGKK